ncbi:MAG: serine/threonine protein kinase/formylglycine-generating enzyme required for sulfatase activity [Planctomycetota bacterium]|jgi:serine/threonine protein kinase/formylglycine-generating enzyme required for sulfatase activity
MSDAYDQSTSSPTDSADTIPAAGTFFRRARADRPVPAQGLFEGKVVGDFRLGKLLGQGGMGQVWEAYQDSLSRQVAVKFVRPERVTEYQLKLFAREARAGGRLSHPGIVTVFGHGESDGLAWIAMELVPGAWDLRDFLDEMMRANELPAGYDRRVATFVAKIADAVFAAHEAGVIHRDLKPQNILITEDDLPKVTDFGLARIVDESALSVTGDLAGTYFYMSPEQVAAKRSGLDHRTDIFSLGIVLYELLSLVRPFQGDTEHQIAEQIMGKDPADLRTIRSRVPRDLAVITGKALEKDRDRRFGTMGDLAADLRRWLANEPIQSTSPTRTDRVVKWCKRNPTKSVASVLVSVTFVVILGLMLKLETKTEEAEDSARIAEQRATDLDAERAKLATTNDELASKTELAEEQTALAQFEERVAATRLNDILSLSASKDLEELIAEADELWPPDPELIPRYEDWLERVRLLIEGRSANEQNGLAARPSLVRHKLKLDELRELAIPVIEENALDKAREHASFGELESKRAESLWFARMLWLESWPDEAEVEATLTGGTLPSDSEGLSELVRSLIGGDALQENALQHGQEMRALLIARRALEAANDHQRANSLDMLAWATFRVGRLDEALAISDAAVAIAKDRTIQESHTRLLAVASHWQYDALEQRSVDRNVLTGEIVDLKLEVGESRFADPQDAWWHRQLLLLVDGLEALVDRQSGLASDTLEAKFGWGILKRLDFAQSIAERSVSSPRAKMLWDGAIDAIGSSPKYAGLTLTPQLGLLPIGPDPASGLWEFAHLMTGEPAVREENGQLRLKEATGLVLVLIPAGTFQMGAQSKDPAQPNYDARAQIDESPVHTVSLSAYFLSKYEMTQGQWQRVSGSNPSSYNPKNSTPLWNRAGRAINLLHPVEQVDWVESRSIVEVSSLQLPSEAQWENGCRAGTGSVYWTGEDLDSLKGAANLSDAYGKSHGNGSFELYEANFDDGNTAHAEVGSYFANAFGLHDTHGNVWEWCLDNYEATAYEHEEVRDPLILVEGPTFRVSRGGSFFDTAVRARSARRFTNSAAGGANNLGLRPARALQVSTTPLHD